MAAIDITPEEADHLFDRLERWHLGVVPVAAEAAPPAPAPVAAAPAPAVPAAPIGARTQLRRFVRSLRDASGF